ncbi:hypothetical protein RhiirC2_715469 [Rhizophagus irregularis]|uniref:MYND-type domain-containing protein n=1 Tax=Rhizophagus irregularis TaxID=588596 RepID=A0A2N1MV97_9GLOM|nr:hypothetical protein RhiirC2_715469 [Rhizophagus irregularis]
MYEVNNLSTEDIINHEKSKKMELMLNFNEYYNDKDKKPKSGCLHIFIVPTSTGSVEIPRILREKFADDLELGPRMKTQLYSPSPWKMSKIFGKDKHIKLKDIYAGAKHSFDEETIINKPLSLEQAIYRESTKSSAYSTINSVTCKKGAIDFLYIVLSKNIRICFHIHAPLLVAWESSSPPGDSTRRADFLVRQKGCWDSNAPEFTCKSSVFNIRVRMEKSEVDKQVHLDNWISQETKTDNQKDENDIGPAKILTAAETLTLFEVTQKSLDHYTWVDVLITKDNDKTENSCDDIKDARVCKRCGDATSTLCTRCQSVYYCSQYCQKEDRKRHKKEDCT